LWLSEVRFRRGGGLSRQGCGTCPVAVHAEAGRIHSFVDGNGRSTRLLADLVLLAARGDDDLPAVFDWAVDKVAYIQALRRYDQTRDPTELAALVGLILID